MTLRTLTILYLVLLACPLSGLAGDRVLLHSAAAPDGWTVAVAAGLCPEQNADCRVVEYFLGPPWEGEDFFEDRFDRLRADWAGRTPEAVAADGPTAFAFVRKYRGELFGDAPVVYLGMPAPDADRAGDCGRCSGVPLRLGVAATVDLVFRLRPETGVLVVVMDDAVENQALRERVETAMEPHLDHARVIFPGHEPGDDDGLDMETLDAVASSAPDDGAVLYLGFAVDNAGNGVDEAAAVRRLVERSRAPVYVLTDRWLGLGVLGGVAARGRDQARAAADLAVRLARRPAEEVPPRSVAPRPVIDRTVLARFGVPASRLPKDAVGINLPPAPPTAAPPTSTGQWLLAALLVPAVLFCLRRLRRKRR